VRVAGSEVKSRRGKVRGWEADSKPAWDVDLVRPVKYTLEGERMTA